MCRTTDFHPTSAVPQRHQSACSPRVEAVHEASLHGVTAGWSVRSVGVPRPPVRCWTSSTSSSCRRDSRRGAAWSAWSPCPRPTTSTIRGRRFSRCRGSCRRRRIPGRRRARILPRDSPASGTDHSAESTGVMPARSTRKRHTTEVCTSPQFNLIATWGPSTHLHI